MGIVNDVLVFTAIDGLHGRELWRSDGTSSGTNLLFDIVPPAEGSDPITLFPFNGLLYFIAYDEAHGGELWQSDGSESGTQMAVELFPGNTSSIPSAQMLSSNNEFFIFIGGRLWLSNGTPGSTNLLYSAQSALTQGPLQLVNNRLFFIGYDPINHFELWKSDGTPGGTGMVKALITDELRSPYGLQGFGNWLYFTAHDNNHGWELWRSDGTSAGTTRFMDVLPGTESSSPSYITPAGNFFYFKAKDVTGYSGLWRSDGTVANTTLIKTISPQNSSQSPANLVMGDSLLYFWADDGIHGRELWRSDGTPNGTFMVQDLTPGAGGSALTSLVTFQDTVYFAFDDGVHGQELWRSSGAPGDAELVADLWPGPDGSYPQQMKFLDGKLYLSATDGVYGLEVWWYEPQNNAAARISDIAYGRYHALPGSFTLTDDFLFFVANDHPMGVNQELWAYQRSGNLSALPTVSPYLIMPGEPFTYTLVTGNYSLSPANQVVLSNTLPSEWVNVTLTSTLPMTNTGTGVWSLGTLVAGENGVITQTGWLDAAANQEVTLTITSTLLADGVVYDSQVATQEINLPPSVNAGSNQVGGVGAIIALIATYADPGLDDTHTAMVAWGDGTIEPATVNSATHTIEAQHQYQDAGSFIVTITVFDSDGAAGSDTLLVTTYYQIFLPYLIRWP